jgi:CheY-like chemotaxis protein
MTRREDAMSERAPRSDGSERLVSLSATASPPPLSGVHVLVVDDDVDFRDVVTLMLESAGAHVTARGDGAQALDALRTIVPDVLVMDINLPGPDGLSVMSMIRQHRDPGARAVPAIALSGAIKDLGVARLIQAGFTDWLSKRGSLEGLIQAVTRLAGGAT